MKIFDLDSPFMRALTIIADLLWLNVLALVCCIPIITVGASMTAMHYMALKIVRNEENHITSSFFKAFKQNFKQSTILWLLMILATIVLAADVYIVYYQILDFPIVLEVVIVLVGIIILFTMTFIFPVQAKFDNPIGRTIKNSLFISILQFPKTIVMIALCLLVVVMLLSIYLLPIAVFFGISGPAFVFAAMYNKFFKKLEDQILEKAQENGEVNSDEDEEDVRIFKDEIDESISIREDIR